MALSTNSCESILLLPPIVFVPTTCDQGESTGFVTMTSGATGLYYNENTNTVLPYTNTFGFSLFEASKICLVGGNVVSFDNGLRFTVQYFIDNVAITNVSNLHQGMSIIVLQFFLDQDIINPNANITVNSFNALGLSVTIVLQTVVSVSESKVVYTPVGEEQPPFFTSSFTCNIVPAPKRKTGGINSFGVRCPITIDVSVRAGTEVPPTVNYGVCGIYSNPVLVRGNIYRYTKNSNNRRPASVWS